MNELENLIRNRIHLKGPVSFRDYMDMCLYYPDLGYYNSVGNKIGAKGDFFTSSNVSSSFGAVIGTQLFEMWEIIGCKTFTILEIGAGTGQLCADILHYFHGSTEVYDNLNYWIVEKSPSMRRIEQSKLKHKVEWFDSIEDLPAFDGCVISNELVDNFPVHQVVQLDELMEIFVDDKDGFVEVLMPAGEDLKSYFTALGVHLPRGYRTEVNLDAISWLEMIAKVLKRGFLLTIDYGDISLKLYNESRKEGTLLCYHQHRIKGDPYVHVGEQDITAHVNFSALQYWGAKNGFETLGFTNQSNFLMALGFKDHLLRQIPAGEDAISAALKASRMANLLLIEMGEKFKVLIQSKNLESMLLKGLRLG